MTGEYYWDRCNLVNAGQYLDSQERLIINEFLDHYNPQLCLDISCGSGRFSLPIMKRGICVVAGDRDPIAVKKLNLKMPGSQNRENTSHVLRTNAESLPFRNKVFDCILSIQTVGYLDVRRFFSECNRVLKDNGWFLFNEANRHSYKASIYRRVTSNTQFYRYSHSEICSMLVDSGFQVKDAIGMNWLPIKRDSDNRWIPLATKIESGLKLGSFPSISPWVFYVAQKGRR